jgi:small subunit ribosomal protein S20
VSGGERRCRSSISNAIIQGRDTALANTKSAEKRIRTNQRLAERNRTYRSRVKTMIKKAEQLIFSGQASDGAVREACSTLDKAAVKGIIHKNNAARRKSRLVAKAKAANLAAKQ